MICIYYTQIIPFVNEILWTPYCFSIDTVVAFGIVNLTILIKTFSFQRGGWRKTFSYGDAWIQIIQASDKGKMGEDVKNYAFSLTFQQGREEPVKVPSDVQEFLDKHSSDLVSGNVERIMANFSDRFLNQSRKKAFYEQWFRNSPDSPIQRGLISSEATVALYVLFLLKYSHFHLILSSNSLFSS